MTFEVRFWGVRGSIACPSSRHIGVGGNTSCVEVTAGDRRLILDAGTGIRPLGEHYLETGVRRATILLSHTHWDHINGFPFFTPAFMPDGAFTVMAGHLGDEGGIRKVLSGQMAQPFFPVPLEAMRGALDFADFTAGESFALGADVTVRTAPLNHPNGATGYRVEHGGRAVCYVTDTEHVPGRPDDNVLGLVAGADLVIYDCTYTDAEFPERVGWGHSTWQEGVRLCEAAGARRLAIFHHDPGHDDAFMAALETEARERWPGAFVARESATVALL